MDLTKCGKVMKKTTISYQILGKTDHELEAFGLQGEGLQNIRQSWKDLMVQGLVLLPTDMCFGMFHLLSQNGAAVARLLPRCSHWTQFDVGWHHEKI